MIFKCMGCGKDIVSGFLHSPRLFCDNNCRNLAARLKKYTAEERKAELERRRKALYEEYGDGTAKATDGKGIVVKCVVCGEDITQITAMPKLYCSNVCQHEQQRKRKVPAYVLKEERRLRKLAFINSLSPERRAKLEYGRIKRGEFKEREAERLGGTDSENPLRHCHNFYTKVKCPNMTWDYYCDDCKKENRRKAGLDMDGVETESIWDGF